MTTTSPVTVASTSKQWKVTLKDLAQSLVSAIVTPLIPIITESLDQGSLTFNAKPIEVAAALGFIGWLSKKFIQPSQTVITGAIEGATVTTVIPAAGTTSVAAQTVTTKP